MLGADRYYMKCWHTDPKGLSGFVAIDLVIGDRIGTKSDKWSEDGRRGGGGGPMNSGGKSTPLPVRRLWHDNKIAGAKATELKVRNDAEHYIEEFSNLKPYGDIQLPMKIAWQYIASSMQNDITLYEIENVEFPKNIDEKWFDAKEKEDFNSP